MLFWRVGRVFILEGDNAQGGMDSKAGEPAKSLETHGMCVTE